MAISDVGETSIDRTETVIPLSHVSYRYFTGFYLHRSRSLHFASYALLYWQLQCRFCYLCFHSVYR